MINALEYLEQNQETPLQEKVRAEDFLSAPVNAEDFLLEAIEIPTETMPAHVPRETMPEPDQTEPPPPMSAINWMNRNAVRPQQPTAQSQSDGTEFDPVTKQWKPISQNPPRIIREIDQAADYWSQYLMTPEEETALQLKHPNWMALRNTAAMLALPGISDKFTSKRAMDEFVNAKSEDQRREILGLAAGYALFPAAAAGAKTVLKAAASKFPKAFGWLEYDLGSAFKEKLRLMTNRERGLVVQGLDETVSGLEKAGASEAEILRYLRREAPNIAEARYRKTQKMDVAPEEPPPVPGPSPVPGPIKPAPAPAIIEQAPAKGLPAVIAKPEPVDAVAPVTPDVAATPEPQSAMEYLDAEPTAENQISSDQAEQLVKLGWPGDKIYITSVRDAQYIIENNIRPDELGKIPVDLEAIEVNVEVMRGPTGETNTASMPAKKAYEAITRQKTNYENFLDCLAMGV